MGLLEEEKQLLEERVKELTLQLETAQTRERVSLCGLSLGGLSVPMVFLQRDSKALLDVQSNPDINSEFHPCVNVCMPPCMEYGVNYVNLPYVCTCAYVHRW